MVRFFAGAALIGVCVLVTSAAPMTHSTAHTTDAHTASLARNQAGMHRTIAIRAIRTVAAAVSQPALARPEVRSCEPSALRTGRVAVAEDARPRTARVLDRALAERGLLDRGKTWIGKMDAVGRGERDVIVYVPDTLDLVRPIELIVYMEGFWSFSDRAIRDRHVAGIARLIDAERNFVYVSPDVPSSVHGDQPKSRKLYWTGKCSPGQRCRSGDFVEFYRQARGMIERALCREIRAASREPVFELSLIGFSNGGNGVFSAVRQLAASDSDVTLASVNLTRIVFADAIYGQRWLFQTWDRVQHLGSLKEFSVLLIRGPMSQRGPGARNRLVARKFFAKYRPEVDLSAIVAGRVVSGPIHVALLAKHHGAIGDYSVYYHPDEVPDTETVAAIASAGAR